MVCSEIELDCGRFHGPEGLFKPELWGLDSPGIHKLVYKAIQVWLFIASLLFFCELELLVYQSWMLCLSGMCGGREKGDVEEHFPVRWPHPDPGLRRTPDQGAG
jgi:hypothetical protein